MPPLKTRASTQVYTEAPAPDHVPEFLEREIEKVETFGPQRVQGRTYLPKDQIRTLLAALIEASLQGSRRARQQGLLPADPAQVPTKTTFQDKVNSKRRLIAACIRNQQTLNLTQVARFTKSCPQTVKKVYWDLIHHREVDDFEYNHKKSRQELQVLEDDVKSIAGGLASVADLKRRHPTFSRKKILEVLHSQDLRWRKLPLAEPKFLTYAPAPQGQVNKIIGMMAQVHSEPGQQMLFVDEMKFPLIQTAKYHWIGRNSESAIKLNRREVQDTVLTAIAMCSTERFVGVQIYRGEVTGPDFLFFLNETIARLPQDRKYLVLADNATWHNSGLLQRTEAYKYMYFNAPRMFQINLIENAFSAVRAEFRKRPIVDTLEREAQTIVNLFFSDHNTARFPGYLRNHLRMLQKYHK
jgi:hypothetical protein